MIAAGTRGELKNSAGSAGIRIRLLDPAHRARARAVIGGRQIAVRDDPDPAVLSARIPAQQRAGAAAELAARTLGRLTSAGIGVSDFAPGIPILFTLLVTYLFGGALAGSTHGYLQFLLPGTLVLATVLVTVYSGVTLNADLATGAFDRFRSMPAWRPAPILGALIGDVARYLLAGGLVIGLGLAMGYRPAGGAAGVLAAIALVLLFASALSWAWITPGLILRAPNAVMSTGFVILFPVTFMSNIFVDPRTMPGWLRGVSDVNPVSHPVTATRALTAGTPATPQVLWTAAAAGLLIAVFAPLTALLYQRK